MNIHIFISYLKGLAKGFKKMLARPLTKSPTTSFSLNWRDTDLMGELFS